jgi:hypothetical protein
MNVFSSPDINPNNYCGLISSKALMSFNKGKSMPPLHTQQMVLRQAKIRESLGLIEKYYNSN